MLIFFWTLSEPSVIVITDYGVKPSVVTIEPYTRSLFNMMIDVPRPSFEVSRTDARFTTTTTTYSSSSVEYSSGTQVYGGIDPKNFPSPVIYSVGNTNT